MNKGKSTTDLPNVRFSLSRKWSILESPGIKLKNILNFSKNYLKIGRENMDQPCSSMAEKGP